MNNLKLLELSNMDMIDVIKEEIEKELVNYKDVVYSIDDISMAKSDRSYLNKLFKQLNDKRIELEKEYLLPFNMFKTKFKSITDEIKSAVTGIDNQIKFVESKAKVDKRALIEEWFKEELTKVDFDISSDMIFDSKWLNKSTTEKAIRFNIQASLLNIENDIKSIKLLNSNFESTLLESYFKDLNLITTIELNNTLNNTIDTPEVKKPHIVINEAKEEYSISLKCTNTQLEDLKNYLDNNDIEFLI